MGSYGLPGSYLRDAGSGLLGVAACGGIGLTGVAPVGDRSDEGGIGPMGYRPDEERRNASWRELVRTVS
jgi:hypothetical protein